MSKHYDATLKTLVENHPRDWVEGLGLPMGKSVEVIDADVSTVTSQANKVIHITGRRPFLLHLELQSSYDKSLPSRMLQYNTLLYVRHGIPVHSAVVLLRKQAGYGVTGRLRYSIGGAGSIDFRYQTIKIWECPVVEFMNSGFGLLPLAPLAHVSQQETRGILKEIDERLCGETPGERDNLLTATYMLLGLRYPPNVVDEWMKEFHNMRESSTYQHVLRQGETRGARKVLRTAGAKKLGRPSPRVRSFINGLSRFEEIERLIARIPEVSTWDELVNVK